MNLPTNSAENARPILVVDDDVVFARMLREVIESWQIPNPVHHLVDGAMLLEYLTVCYTLGSWVQPLPALIMLDFNMPNVDGAEVIKWLKKAKLDHLPVVIVSGADASKTAAKVKKLGGQHFMSKPLEPDDYEAIKKLLKIPQEIAR
ncbi:MAG: response regulator [Limisphaerales bacterium]